MKKTLTRLFWPILKFFEAGESKGHYKKSHRTALNGVGGLFLLLALISAVAANAANQVGALIPVLIFFSAGVIALVVGSLGSDKAVARIWGSRGQST